MIIFAIGISGNALACNTQTYQGCSGDQLRQIQQGQYKSRTKSTFSQQSAERESRDRAMAEKYKADEIAAEQARLKRIEDEERAKVLNRKARTGGLTTVLKQRPDGSWYEEYVS